jgi:hypothetical protein
MAIWLTFDECCRWFWFTKLVRDNIVTEEVPMASDKPQPFPEPAPAAQHVVEAHGLLQRLREKLGEHAELERAIEELEMALSKLTIKTGGML